MTGVNPESFIKQGEHGLQANAEVQIQNDNAILIVTNTLKNDIYIPINSESENIICPTGESVHMDGGMVVFPSDFEILKPSETKQYKFTLHDYKIVFNTEYTFTIWAPIRDSKNWKKILKKSDVVYEIIGKYKNTKEKENP